MNGRVDSSSIPSLVNFKVPSRSNIYRVPYIVPAHTTNYGRNNPLDLIVSFETYIDKYINHLLFFLDLNLNVIYLSRYFFYVIELVVILF